MNRIARLLLALLASLTLPISARGQGVGHAHAELLADVSAIKAGQPFMVGVRITIDPGWHIYWTNPGDSGLPTKVKLTLPPGFTVGPVQYPVPVRLQLPGDIVNYAYVDEVVLLAQVTPPNELPENSVTIDGKATWLVCNDSCIPGSSPLKLTLGVSESSVRDNVELFKTWTGRLPVNEDQVNVTSAGGSLAKGSPSDGDRGTVIVHWKTAVTDVQFLPAAVQNGDLSDIRIVSAGPLSTITFLVKPGGNEKIEGLITYDAPDGQRIGLKTAVSILH